jgi:L-arabinose isomerase
MLFKPTHLGIEDWCDAWCKGGSPHHMALAYGHLAGKLKLLAEMCGMDFVEI